MGLEMGLEKVVMELLASNLEAAECLIHTLYTARPCGSCGKALQQHMQTGFVSMLAAVSCTESRLDHKQCNSMAWSVSGHFQTSERSTDRVTFGEERSTRVSLAGVIEARNLVKD